MMRTKKTKCCKLKPCEREEAEVKPHGTVITARVYCRNEKCPNGVAITTSMKNEAIAEAMVTLAWEELLSALFWKRKAETRPQTMRETLLQKRKKK